MCREGGVRYRGEPRFGVKDSSLILGHWSVAISMGTFWHGATSVCKSSRWRLLRFQSTLLLLVNSLSFEDHFAVVSNWHALKTLHSILTRVDLLKTQNLKLISRLIYKSVLVLNPWLLACVFLLISVQRWLIGDILAHNLDLFVFPQVIWRK